MAPIGYYRNDFSVILYTIVGLLYIIVVKKIRKNRHILSVLLARCNLFNIVNTGRDTKLQNYKFIVKAFVQKITDTSTCAVFSNSRNYAKKSLVKDHHGPISPTFQF